jgi:hypothetical protein
MLVNNACFVTFLHVGSDVDDVQNAGDTCIQSNLKETPIEAASIEVDSHKTVTVKGKF